MFKGEVRGTSKYNIWNNARINCRSDYPYVTGKPIACKYESKGIFPTIKHFFFVKHFSLQIYLRKSISVEKHTSEYTNRILFLQIKKVVIANGQLQSRPDETTELHKHLIISSIIIMQRVQHNKAKKLRARKIDKGRQ